MPLFVCNDLLTLPEIIMEVDGMARKEDPFLKTSGVHFVLNDAGLGFQRERERDRGRDGGRGTEGGREREGERERERTHEKIPWHERFFCSAGEHRRGRGTLLDFHCLSVV